MGNTMFWVIIVGWLLVLVAGAIYFNLECRKAVKMDSVGCMECVNRAFERFFWISFVSMVAPIMAAAALFLFS